MERANQTLQDRLVKEMRLRGIGDMAAGNAYLAEFMADFNRRFAVAPRNPADAHRAVLHDAAELDLILCEHHARKLTKNLTIGFQSREYQVMGRGNGYRLRGAEVTVCKAFDGSVTVLRDGRELPVRLLAAGEEAVPVEDEKTVVRRVDQAKAEQRSRPTYKPRRDSLRIPGIVAGAPIGTGRQECRGDISALEKRGHFCFALTRKENGFAATGSIH